MPNLSKQSKLVGLHPNAKNFRRRKINCEKSENALWFT